MTDPDSPTSGRLFVITGARAVGKTACGKALAQALTRAVFLDGDTIGDSVVSGKAPMTEPATVDAVDQLFLRYAGALALADVYRSGGFDVVIADTIIGSYLDGFLEIAEPDLVHLVMLNPTVDAIYERDEQRRKTAYEQGLTVEDLWRTVEEHTRRAGLWLDTSNMSVAQTITQILRRIDETRVDTTAVERERARQA